jgi:hypothetical protein
MTRFQEEENMVRVLDDLVGGTLGTDNLTLTKRNAQLITGLFHRMEGQIGYLNRCKLDLKVEVGFLREAVQIGKKATSVLASKIMGEDYYYGKIRELERKADDFGPSHQNFRPDTSDHR